MARTMSKANAKLGAQIMYALMEDGDINENHAHGNASRTLVERIQDRGVSVTPREVNSRLLTLNKKGWITRVTEGRRTFAIRLALDPAKVAAKVGPNPFTKNKKPRRFEPLADLDVAQAPPATNGNGLSVRERLGLAIELITEIKSELDRTNI